MQAFSRYTDRKIADRKAGGLQVGRQEDIRKEGRKIAGIGYDMDITDDPDCKCCWLKI